MAIKRTHEVNVWKQGRLGHGMNLKEIEAFCKEAREAGFGDKDVPWVDNTLAFSMSLTRSEPS